MKHIKFLCIAIIFPAEISSAHETDPYRLKQLQEAHTEKAEHLDRAYIRSLEKPEGKCITRGDLDSPDLVARIIESQRPDGCGLSDLCQIRVNSDTRISAETLKGGVPRLSGGYRPSFSFVAEEMEGARFIRVPWKSKPRYQVEVLKSGFLYLLGVDGKTIANTTLKLDAVPDRLKGSYVGNVYAVYVTAGQTFECGGYETCLIAGEISIE